MIRRRNNWLYVSVPGLVAVLLVVGTVIATGPKTPMSVAEADRFFAKNVRPGQTREEVEGWLQTQEFNFRGEHPGRPMYVPIRCGGDRQWIDCYGSRNAAEWAGLPSNSVHYIGRVVYGDAAYFQHTEVTVYLFFDADDRLMGQWVGESTYGL